MADPLPPFDVVGNLPAGDYWPGELDFDARFVNVTGSTARPVIYQGYKLHRSELLSQGVAASSACLLNGSYTTSKVDPGDIDLVVEIDAALIHPVTPSALGALVAGPGCKAAFNCDAYCVPVLPANHPDFATVTQALRDYWHKWFGRDRLGNAKGRVWTTVGGFK